MSFFKVLCTIDLELFQYLTVEDHSKLALAFTDRYVNILVDKLGNRSYRRSYIDRRGSSYSGLWSGFYSETDLDVDLDLVIKHVLSNVLPINRLKSTTLERLHRGFWNHISLECKLKEKFIYKWSHKISMRRLAVNRNVIFSAKFYSVFPGMLRYEPCCECFEDTSYDYPQYYVGNDEWSCVKCMLSNIDCEDDCDRYTKKDSDHGGGGALFEGFFI